ncbi:MAG: hypothetical protein GY809_26800 [Planctomycetes bacterium]|nr:hypothetical protein [Planctomycetota bacterium]
MKAPHLRHLDTAGLRPRTGVWSWRPHSPKHLNVGRPWTRLQTELVHRAKANLFDHRKGYMTVDRDKVPYQTTAQALGMTEDAVKVAVHRLRKRYRDLLQDEIAQTVSDETQINEEISRLFAALAQ